MTDVDFAALPAALWGGPPGPQPAPRPASGSTLIFATRHEFTTHGFFASGGLVTALYEYIDTEAIAAIF